MKPSTYAIILLAIFWIGFGAGALTAYIGLKACCSINRETAAKYLREIGP